MDVNRTRFALLRDREELLPKDQPGFSWGPCGLCLAQAQPPALPTTDRDAVHAALAAASAFAVDGHGQLARLSGDRRTLEARAGGAFEAVLAAHPLESPGTPTPSKVEAPRGRFRDLALGGDGRVALAFDGDGPPGVLLFHLRERWQREVLLPFVAERVAVDSAGRTWAVGKGQVARIEGQPLPQPWTPGEARFEPAIAEPAAPRVVATTPLPALDAAVAETLGLVADGDSLVLLVEVDGGAQSLLRAPLRALLQGSGSGSPFEAHELPPNLPADGTPLPYFADIAALDPHRYLLLPLVGAQDLTRPDAHPGAPTVDRRDALAVSIEATGLYFEQRRYPLAVRWHGTGAALVLNAVPRFAKRGPGDVRLVTGPRDAEIALRIFAAPHPRYPARMSVVLPQQLASPLTGFTWHLLDSGEFECVWHRCTLEAQIPRGTSIRVYARVAEDPEALTQAEWQRQPRLNWRSGGSELPHFSGEFPREPRVSGEFSVLLQRSRGPSRRLAGRYLELRLDFESDGRSTPSVRSVRVWHPRFDYQDRYLPIYLRAEPSSIEAAAKDSSPKEFRQRLRAALQSDFAADPAWLAGAEQLLSELDNPGPQDKLDQDTEELLALVASYGGSPPNGWNSFAERFRRDAHSKSRASGADFRERLLAVLEAELTPLEGRVAEAEVLLDPEAVPARSLAQLERLLGVTADPAAPEQRRRHRLRGAALRRRWRGTARGLRVALDIETDGAVGRGEIVIVENWRLRRTVSTLLGVLIDDRQHPLTLGSLDSGNSIVGESLILAPDSARELLALFSPELAQGEDAALVAAFFERHAHRVSVLLYGPAREREAAVRRTLAAELPAHIQAEVYPTDRPFVIGLSPLLDVHSRLEAPPPPSSIVLDGTRLGRDGIVRAHTAFLPERVKNSKTS